VFKLDYPTSYVDPMQLFILLVSGGSSANSSSAYLVNFFNYHSILP